MNYLSLNSPLNSGALGLKFNTWYIYLFLIGGNTTRFKTMINHLSQKIKLTGNNEFNHLIFIMTKKVNIKLLNHIYFDLWLWLGQIRDWYNKCSWAKNMALHGRRAVWEPTWQRKAPLTFLPILMQTQQKTPCIESSPRMDVHRSGFNLTKK